MKQLVNNPFKYFLGRYILPIIGTVFNVVTLMYFYDKTYFYFYHHLSYCVYKDLLLLNPSKVDLSNWRGHRILLWDDLKQVSIHNETSCVVSVYFSSLWDKNMNHQIYYLLR
jgi:hypothetical protein